MERDNEIRVDDDVVIAVVLLSLSRSVFLSIFYSLLLLSLTNIRRSSSSR